MIAGNVHSGRAVFRLAVHGTVQVDSGYVRVGDYDDSNCSAPQHGSKIRSDGGRSSVAGLRGF